MLKDSSIVCIQEHWLWSFEAENVIQGIFPSKGYHIRSVDESDNIDPVATARGHGGVATIWDKNIDPLIQKTNDGNERILVTVINLSKTKRYCIFNCYLPAGEGRSAMETYAEDVALIDNLIDKYSKDAIIIIGDMNADIINRKGKKEKMLLELLDRHRLQVLNRASSQTPTYEHKGGKGKSHIDYIIADVECTWSDFRILGQDTVVGALNSSPHHPLCASIHTESLINQRGGNDNQDNQMLQLSRIHWKEVDTDVYKELLSEELKDINFHLLDPGEGLRVLADTISNTASASQKRRPPKKRKAKKKIKIWSLSIREAVGNAKHKFWRWKKEGRPGPEHPLTIKKKEASKKLRSVQRKEVARKRAQFLKEIMEAYENDSKTFHKLISMNKRNTEHTSVLMSENQLIHDAEEQRILWASYFEKLSAGSSADITEERTHLRLIREYHNDHHRHEYTFTTFDIQKVVKTLNKGKAADLQGITAEHLQQAPVECHTALTHIINQIFTEGKFPDVCKTGFKIPIPKKGKDSKILANHRGITITSLLGKIIEKLIQEATDEAFLPIQSKLQFGFTKGLSPSMATLCLTEAIGTAREEKRQLLVGSLDVQKAFDVVCQEKLKRKLHSTKLPSNCWSLIDTIYQNITETVRWKGGYSPPFVVAKGVRQGAILSTTLYKLYINDLLKGLESAGVGMSIGNTYMGSPTCADDQLLIATTNEDLQAMLEEIKRYSDEHLYSIHPDKSSITKLVTSNTSSNDCIFKLGNGVLPETSSFTHLGLEWLKGKSSPNITSRIQQARRAAYALMGAGLHGGNGLSPHVSLKILNTYIIPRLLYGLEAVILTKKDVDDLNFFHKSILRRLQGLPKNTATEAIFILIGAIPITAELHIRILSLFGAIWRSENNNIMKDLAMRQLGRGSRHSWFTYAINTAQLYNVDLVSSTGTPWRKADWKTYIQTAIQGKWRQTLLAGKANKSSLAMLDPTTSSSHPLWTACIGKPRLIPPANVRAKFITGTYQNMHRSAKWNKQPQNGICHICMHETEDNSHILLRCQGFQEERTTCLLTLTELNFPIRGRGHESLRRLLNGPAETKDSAQRKKWMAIHSCISAYCHKIHTKRQALLVKNTKVKNGGSIVASFTDSNGSCGGSGGGGEHVEREMGLMSPPEGVNH